MFEKITFDIESNNLLNEQSINYLSSPYVLKDSFAIHCIVVEDFDTGNLMAFHDGDPYIFDGREYAEKDPELEYEYKLEKYRPITYIHKPLAEWKNFATSGHVKKIIGHNIINFDLLACYLYFGVDYSVDENGDSLGAHPVEIIDTLVEAKVLNPDRFGGNSLDKLSEKTGLRKINFRPYVPIKDRFKTFAADMLYYCIRDVQANTKVKKMLDNEAANWDWSSAFSLEKSVMDIITQQEHRGFAFDRSLAEENVINLDAMMGVREERVNPIIPDKKATKGYMKDFTPPVRQFKKDRQPSSYLIKFIDKIGGKLLGEPGNFKLDFNGKIYDLPLPEGEPLVTTQTATINDTTHIKEWLISEFGWQPSEYKEKDLSVKQVLGVGKVKRTPEEVEKAIDDYVAQTLSSPFCKDRCEHLDTTPTGLAKKLKSYKEGRAIKVKSNPNFTKGQEKDICPNLEALADRFPYAKDIIEYLTYKHRRNSILGGGLEWDDEEEADKGYMAYVREDGRIPTPADTCGAASSRFKHKVVANIPRSTSLFGAPMRQMFGVDGGYYQIGYDFDSLEAKIESHYCWPYENGGHEYCNSLLMEKPFDVHCYSEDTEVLTDKGWKTFGELASTDKVAQYWKDTGAIDFVIPQDVVWQDYEGEMVQIKNKSVSQLVTPNHRVLLKQEGDTQYQVYEARNLPDSFVLPSVQAFYEVSRNTDISFVDYKGKIGCVAVPSSFIVTLKDGSIVISGNTMMAKKISAIIKRDFGRSPAKSVKYACTYGATGPKVAQTIGESVEIGNIVVDAFWEAASPLKALKDRLHTYWEKTGKKQFILGIDGRKVPTRSAHAILNSLFQSAGVICAKRAMVIHRKLIREAGYAVNFFKDDWKNMSYIAQLIAYHDEAQLETTKDLVKFKLFNDEDEAKDWKKSTEESTGRIMSDIGHAGDKFYVAYTIGGELAAKAVKMAGEFYKLNIELTAGYQVGRNWAECH